LETGKSKFEFQLAADREAEEKRKADELKASKIAKKPVNNTLTVFRSGVGKYLNMPSTSK